jgi:DDE superfamily endonuclease
VVVLDGLGAHRTHRVRELIEARGADLVFLPSYSPDLKWDEKAETTFRMEPTMVSASKS